MTESVEDEVNGLWIRNNTLDDEFMLESIMFDDDSYYNSFYDTPYAFLAIRSFFNRFDKQNYKLMLEYESLIKGMFLTDKHIYAKNLS